MSKEEPISLSDRTSVGMPIRNLIGLIGTICVGAWGPKLLHISYLLNLSGFL